MMQRRTLLAASAAMLAAPRIGAAVTVGVTATELKIGNFMPYSGPASAYGVIGRGDAAYFKMINDQGGVGGRQINFITYDDGYSPPRAVEQTRRLVEQDRVALLFHTLGTPSNSAIVRYVNQRRVPHLFLATGADKWGNYQDTPWTIGWQPSYRTEAQIYAKWMLEQKPNAKVALLYQNDDFGKDYVTGVKDVLGARFDQMVTTASYEVTDPTIDSQVVSLRGTGADVLVTAATPKFAAQTIRKVHDIGWQPMHFLSNVSISIAAVMRPAGPERGVGIITSAYQKDITDPVWNDDRHMQAWREFMRKYLPEADMSDSGYATAYNVSFTLMQVLRQCEGDFSRENIMRQVANIHDLEVPLLLPGIKVSTSPTNFHPIRQMQLQKWSGAHWERFGDVIQGADV
ncbi:ABC transporter substrate-binding protein [Neoroseomonas oryzicola]|uniref:ABC transporter substrate-binding protein n=1 Tax=Neoroseomonas oryzicola TaxID=535904 RepID=A0A9X9WM06_9PROT|nr:ABC transporter substrate-binding protein [Neoroseomonas oryzicola]MBR0661366.1 ABC transporter substrate-binding protein [Neoroseomonas oryzicola]NKE17467.1 ABC transporter substrate-binding protein [Neoroseomonas oryzicola]